MGFVFPSEDALVSALAVGLIPAPLRSSPADVGNDASGRFVVTPIEPTAPELERQLNAAGVATTEERPDNSESVAHWLQALQLVRKRDWSAPDDQTAVLFDCASRDAAAELVHEMLRLGNDRQSFRILSPSAGSDREIVLLKVLGPPYYSLLRALERPSTARTSGFLEHKPGIWIELGWAHPLIDQMTVPESAIVLLRPPREWRWLSPGQFRDVLSAADIGPNTQTWEWTETPPPVLPAPLRLAPGNVTDAAELWLLPDGGRDALDSFVQSADPRELDRFTFAIAERESESAIVVRARPGRSETPALPLAGALPFRPYQGLPQLFLPCGSRLTPPVSREIVQRLLAEDPTSVCWLESGENGRFQPKQLPEQSFRPLNDWPEQILIRDRAALEHWAAASKCDFGPMREVEPARSTAPPESRRPIAAPPVQVKPTKPERPATPAPILTRPPTPAPGPPLSPGVAQQQLRTAEERFLALRGPLDAPERRELWPELAKLNTDLDHSSEAALCWLNALWYCDKPDADLARRWVETEKALPNQEISAGDLGRLTGSAQPTAADLRSLAAAVIWSTSLPTTPPAIMKQLASLQHYLEQHDRLLPIRAVWLAWHGLTQRVGRDPLALARVRDRLLERLLADGLNPERDLPTFLRFAGNRTGERLRTVRDRLERIRGSIHRWSGFASDDSLQQTPSYIDLTFAFANARLGEAGAAKALLASAGKAIDASGSDAHRFLLEAYRWRIEQVLAGQPHAGSLPTEQIEYLEQMRREAAAAPLNDPIHSMAPYIVERMRKESRILDPHEELEPYRHTWRQHDAVIREMIRLTDVHEPRALSAGLRRVLQAIGTHRQGEIRLRVLAEALPLAARVGADLAGDFLDQVSAALTATSDATDPITQERQAVLLERALFFALHFDRTDLVPVLAAQLEGLLDETTASTVLDARSRLIGQSLSSFRRCGLRDATDRLLERLAAAAGDPDAAPNRRVAMERCRILLHVATGWLTSDQTDRARPILDTARSLILPTTPTAPDRPAALLVSLVGNYVAAAAHAPLDEALDRTEELFAEGRMEKIPNTFTTAPYYSRFHLNIAEAVVLALANEDFAFGPAARRWLDDDEYAVRRRIHSDLRMALERNR